VKGYNFSIGQSPLTPTLFHLISGLPEISTIECKVG
jgi:hypothetical protein